jgi:hypothetical protein
MVLSVGLDTLEKREICNPDHGMNLDYRSSMVHSLYTNRAILDVILSVTGSLWVNSTSHAATWCVGMLVLCYSSNIL